MGQLNNLYVSSSFQGLLKMTDSTTGLTSTLQTVQGGDGSNSPLQMSLTEVNISGSLTVNGAPIEFTNTGSFATTGSNTFIGNQTIVGNVTFPSNSFVSTDNISGTLYLSSLNQGTLYLNGDGGEGDVVIGYSAWQNNLKVKGGNTEITGSLYSTNIIGTGSLFLQPNQSDARFLEIYNTSPTDTHITASGGQIFLGNDVTYVKVDNYGSVKRIDIVADNGVYVSGSVQITGSLVVSDIQSGSSSNEVVVYNTSTNVLERKTNASSSGTSGSDGSSGTSGSNGTDGSSGTSGSSGSDGSSGTSGSNGTDGSSGTSGSNGTDGSSGTSGLSSSFFNYKAKDTITSGNPGSGHIIWDNAIQSGATSINVSDIDQLGNNVDIFLSNLASGSTISLQDQSSHLNYQEWTLGTGVDNGTYWTFPVTLQTATYSFPNNHDMLFIVITTPSGTSGTSGTNGSSGTSGDSLFALTGSIWNTTNNVGITGSLDINGTTKITGSLNVSGSGQYDINLNGQMLISNMDTNTTRAPRIFLSGSGGNTTISRNSIVTTNTTFTAQLNPFATFAYKNATFDEIGFTVDSGSVSGWTKGPAIYTNDPTDNYPAMIGFQDKANYTDGRITLLKNTDISGSLYVSSSIQKDVIVDGQIWVSSSLVAATGTTTQPQVNVVGYRSATRRGTSQLSPGQITLYQSSSVVGEGQVTISPAVGITIFNQNSIESQIYGQGVGSDNTMTYNEYKGVYNLDGTVDVEQQLEITSSGSLFKDWDNSGLVSSPYMSLAPNNGDNPTPQMLRGLGITGSLNVTNGITGSLQGTASFAISASYAPDGSNRNGLITTGSIAGSQSITGSLIISGSINITGSVQGNISALSISSNTASLNLNDGNFFTLQLVSGSNTRIEPSNIKQGQTINVLLSTTGSATVSFPTTVKQISGSAYVPTITTSKDVITLISFDSSSLYLANVKNFI